MKDIAHLIKQLQQGDNFAFDKIYQLTYRSIFFVAYSILKDKNDCEEILQETFIKFYKNLSCFDENKNAYNWLYTVAKNLAINKYKQNQKISSLDDITINTLQDEKAEIYSQTNFRFILDFARKMLDEEEFLVVMLCVIKGFTRKDVSKMMDKPISTITWIYNKAMKKLSKNLKGGEM